MKAYPIVSLTGPRQSGKTTLVKTLFPHFQYLSLEDLDIREFALKDPRGFLQNYPSEVIIDEAQRAPALFSYLQTHVDQQAQNGQFILTGSQNFLLMENIAQSLAGRVAVLKLLPLSLQELMEENRAKSELNAQIFTGFYPRVYDQKVEVQSWYSNYITTYIERDVRQIKNIHDLGQFQLFLKLCANRVGQLLNLSSLAADCGITHNTAKAWIHLLESSYLVFLLQPYYENFNKRLVKMPKLYFYDTGIVCSLLDLKDPSQVSLHHVKGKLFENFVLSELMKHRLNQEKRPNYYFWRDKTGHEVGCLIDNPNHCIPVEIKSTHTIHSDLLKGIHYWQSLNNSPIKPYVFYAGHENQGRTNAHFLSWTALGKDLSAIDY